MPEHSISNEKLQSKHALLCLLGHKIRETKLLEPFHRLITIKQKTLIHSPTEKLQDCLVGMLMGNTTLYETNTTLSTDQALWQSWGRSGCADQSTIQRTLEECSQENVTQLQQVNALLLQQVGQSLRHDYAKGPLILDGDLTGLPCSKNYEAACPGYFADCPPGTTGRQLFRFSAASYNEIIYEEVFPGNTNSSNLANFKKVLAATFANLGLKPEQKGAVLLRLDAGFGTADILNYLLEEGYQFVVKLFSSSRANKLCREVKAWQLDAKQAGRAMALLEQAPYYEKDVRRQVLQIGVRCRLSAQATKAKNLKSAAAGAGGDELYSYHVLVVNRPELAERLEGEFKKELLLGQLAFYDKRAGIESASFCSDKQGLGLAKRRKRSLVGQEMLIGLAQLAHNLIMWQRHQLSENEPKVGEYGIKCWVRDWLGMGGRLTFQGGQIVKVRVPKRHEVSRQFKSALKKWATQSGVRLILRQI
jgi:ribulose bisphosphate carboxylase small subunit